jgi:glycosyltransferase involved in cell wall biosynthesis
VLPISIVTPAFNAGPFLRETIDSVLAERYSALDYLVVDDGSTDNTAAVAASYGDRIRLLRQANTGEQGAVNAGVATAKNDVVAIVNADDPIRPGLLTAVAAAYTARPELVAVYPDWIMIDGEGRERRYVRTFEYRYEDMLERHCCIPGPGTFFRKSALRGGPVRDPILRYSGDFGLWLRIGLRGPMQRLPGFYATWRQHASGASSSHSMVMASDKIKLIESFFALPDLPETIRSRRRQALSAAYFRAGQHAMHNSSLPGRQWLFKSYYLAPFWSWHPNPVMRRSLWRVLFILAQPVSGWLDQQLSARRLRTRARELQT